MAFDLDPAYKQVPERIADFKAKHPEGCLRPADPAVPYRLEEVGGKTWVVYVAAAYRTPDDPMPGIGIAWEQVPGKTPYTKDSEMMNAETSAWGRAIVAVLASESKSVASAEDIRNRQADHAAPDEPEPVDWFVVNGWDGGKDEHDDRRERLVETLRAATTEAQAAFKAWREGEGINLQRPLTLEQMVLAEDQALELAQAQPEQEAPAERPEAHGEDLGAIQPSSGNGQRTHQAECVLDPSHPGSCAAEFPQIAASPVACELCGSGRAQLVEVDGVTRCSHAKDCEGRAGVAQARMAMDG